ncbi:hypothetical protein J6590_057802 [Homalodisca vitripennis]|nr:hypothetical protein J6590_057802 [Homalodisca vitripennis]
MCHDNLPRHSHETRGRGNYQTGKHITVVDEHLSSRAGVQFINKLPIWIKNLAASKQNGTQRLQHVFSLVPLLFRNQRRTTYVEHVGLRLQRSAKLSRTPI